ncbi:MAG: hypothetical protein IKP58_13960, partial [Victivallales bacterium]|nr:hypothetical protein [Victivallales bacterium]
FWNSRQSVIVLVLCEAQRGQAHILSHFEQKTLPQSSQTHQPPVASAPQFGQIGFIFCFLLFDYFFTNN